MLSKAVCRPLILLIDKVGMSVADSPVPEIALPYESTVSFVYVPLATPDAARLSVRSVDRSPPPDRPVPAMTLVAFAAFLERRSSIEVDV